MPEEDDLPQRPPDDDETELMTPPTGGAPILPPRAPLHEVIGDFEVLGRLGAGGMGAVYRARQVSLDRLVALKVLPAQFSEDAESIARFQREARVAASLSHANLVRIYSAGEADGCHYIAMELIEGEDLGRRLKRAGRLTAPDALGIIADAARGLQYGWQKAQLVHRDIKPGNIFLAGDSTVKVGDLGLAKLLDSSSTGLTQTGTMMGTPHYISPEQAKGDRDLDFRADIYSLGCTLYQMLTGQVPYAGSDPVTIIHQHIHAPLPAILKAWPQCPVPLARLVGRMLKKHKHERHASYAELLAQIEGVWAQIEPLRFRSRPFAPPSEPAKGEVPEPTLVAAADHHGHLPAEARDGPPPPRQSRSKLPIYGGLFAGVLVLGAAAFLLSRPKEEPLTEAQKNMLRREAEEKARAAVTPAPDISREPATLTGVAEALTFGGHRYQLIAGQITWDDARAKAAQLGGYLAVLGSEAEHAWVNQTFKAKVDSSYPRFWIGGTAAREGDAWRWVNGEPFSWTRWHSVEPNYATSNGEKLEGPFGLLVDTGDGGWREVPSRWSAYAHGFLVEWDGQPAAVSPSPNPQISSPPASSTAIRLWDTAAKVPAAPGVVWEDGTLRLEKKQVVERAPVCRNAILRASVRRDFTDFMIGLRYTGQSRADHFYAIAADAGANRIKLRAYTGDGGKGTILKDWPLPPNPNREEWLGLELRVVNEDITVSADGQTLGTVRDATVAAPGGVSLYSFGTAVFRDVTLTPLDGAPAPKAAAEPWQDALRDPEMIHLNANVKRVPEGLRFTGQSHTYIGPRDQISRYREGLPSTAPKRDAAVRMRATYSGGYRPGLAARSTKDAGAYYLGLIDRETAQLRRWDVRTTTSIEFLRWKLPHPLEVGQPYTLELRARGRTLTASYNGEVLGTATDDALSEGLFGVSLGSVPPGLDPTLVTTLELLDLDAAPAETRSETAGAGWKPLYTLSFPK